MTYNEFIQNILNTRGRFACGGEYHERHHIVPKCMGGTNDKENLIDLYAREHFEAHRLLALENPSNKSLIFAWTCMAFPNSGVQKRCELTPKEYEEARKAISKVLSGRKLSEETKKKLSESKKGSKLSVETKEKLSKSLKGRVLSDEHKNKISIANTGKVFSDEHKANISKAKKGKPLSESEKAARIKVGEMNRGRKCSEETKAKISAANKGKHISEETRKKMSEVKKGKRGNRATRVAQYDLKGSLIKEWESMMDASQSLGIDNSRISKCAKGQYGCKTAGGFVWKFI